MPSTSWPVSTPPVTPISDGRHRTHPEINRPRVNRLKPINFSTQLSLNTPMGPEIDGELKREMSLQMLENRTYRRFHSGKSEGHPAGGTISYPGRDRCGIR